MQVSYSLSKLIRHNIYVRCRLICIICVCLVYNKSMILFSPGQWKVPFITGDRPSPCAYFTMNILPGNRCVMFGGTIIDHEDFHRVSDVYLLSCSLDTIVSRKT